ncbi:neuritin-like isoform X1 [Pleurodeles waltl]|uniref:neuritin-like isoform X1 n=1 Tax=Pleurodeles waltl TaxID=8319 RepID=UPI0037098F44
MEARLLATWLWLGILCSAGLHCAVANPSSSAASTRCEHIYRGFSECLLALSTHMSVYTEEELNSTQNLDNICAHWEEFHACGMAAMLDCRVEVQAVWDSLRRESTRLSFEGNMYEMCASHTQGRLDRMIAPPSSSSWLPQAALLPWTLVLSVVAWRIE